MTAENNHSSRKSQWDYVPASLGARGIVVTNRGRKCTVVVTAVENGKPLALTITPALASRRERESIKYSEIVWDPE